MRNKLICTALAAFLLLTGCGKGNETGTPSLETGAPETTVQQTVELPSAETEATTEAVTESGVPDLLGYTLLWNDEFDGDTLDESIWDYEPHDPGWTNEELQEYTTSTDNVFLRDGNLVIKAIKTEKDGADWYTSGKIKSQNKKDFTYGKVVARTRSTTVSGRNAVRSTSWRCSAALWIRHTARYTTVSRMQSSRERSFLTAARPLRMISTSIPWSGSRVRSAGTSTAVCT